MYDFNLLVTDTFVYWSTTPVPRPSPPHFGVSCTSTYAGDTHCDRQVYDHLRIWTSVCA